MYHLPYALQRTTSSSKKESTSSTPRGADTLAEIIELADSRAIELRLARVKTTVKDVLERDGVVDRLGEGRIYGNVYEAAADQIPAAPVPQADSN